jgi:hypothetical protein
MFLLFLLSNNGEGLSEVISGWGNGIGAVGVPDLSRGRWCIG